MCIRDRPIASIEKISTKIFPSINSYASSISIHLVHNTKTTAVIANKNIGASPKEETKTNPMKALKTSGACFLLYALH